MSQHEFKCDMDQKDTFLLYLDDQVEIELHSQKDNILFSDDDAEDLANKILAHLADKRAAKAVSDAEDRQEQADMDRERALEDKWEYERDERRMNNE